MTDLSLGTAEMHGWLDRIRAGDPGALDGLLKRAGARLERLSRKLLKRFPRIGRWVEAEDVLQNAALRLIRSLQEIRPHSMRHFYGLAAMQIRRELLDLTKTLYGPEGEAAHHDSVGDSFNAVEPAACVEDALELEKWRRFHEAVEKLPAEEREVMGLIFYHGWAQAKVAELFGVTVRTIQRWWQSALDRLRRILADQQQEPTR